ncbi:corticotropin-releasing factor-binding protein [Callorhinchus milii]|uniref:Corticotropin-releasing factor-binding protein n=1 Tax=Callorhinchus milii TaxID=7868 RepID=A0A4W3GH79_CALMI|nr:corticotropin-releasing factor-binding protein [Callorhinchus milii]|eukprot:gi/632974255/ref/XP_007903572.1/ PREDICTED: corticotropin-releasing factor-binding protein [Callorhinchus milii]
MSPGFKVQLHLALLWMVILQGRGRYIEQNEIIDDVFGMLNSELKRELSEDYIYRRSLKCIDMLSLDGQFTFTADRPQLNCATFFISSPDEIITIEYNYVNIDCQGGDFLKVFDGWILRGEKFPSTIDHLLPLAERYIDFCDGSGTKTVFRSSQNVAMLFFRIHMPGNGFSLTVTKLINPFPCNVISQTPDGRFTMVIPHQKRNCSFSIIYPVEIKLSDLSLGHFNNLHLKIPITSCSGATDFIELLGGNKLDPSRMYPVADICYSFSGPAQMKVGCDNTVVRMVSSGKYINRLTFEYRQLSPRELEKPNRNSVEDFCYTDD